MKRRFFHLVRWVVFAAIAIFVLSSIYLAQVLMQEGELIEHTYRQGTWSAVQTDSEALKLLLALERYRRTQTAEDLQGLTLQRELYLSRVIFLRDSDETKAVRAISQIQEPLHRMFDDAEQIDRAVDRIAGGNLSNMDRLQSVLARDRLVARDLTQHLLLKDSTLLSRERLIEAFERMAISLLFILAAGGILVLTSLRQANRAVASAREAQLAQQEVSRERQRLESALEATPDALMIGDSAGRVVFANPAYRKLVPHDGGASGTRLPDVLASEAETLEYDRANTALASEACFVARAQAPGDSFMARLKDGRSLLYRTHRTTEGGLVLTRTDLTERMRLERERGEFRDQFHHAMKMEALGRLAGGIAHDFNNMLTAILTFSQMLSEDLADRPQQQRMATKVIAATLRAAGLVRQILSFSRKEQTALQEVDLADVAKETLGLLRASTPQSILTSLEGRPGGIVMADPGQISQLIMNLCVNARDAINVRPGAIEVAIRHPVLDRGLPGSAVAVPKGAAAIGIVSGPRDRTHLMHVGEMAPNRACVCLSIRDNGGGIPRPVLERMFEPFYTTKGVGQGSGLGLAAVHGIVLGLDGTIMVETTEGAGTIFRIFLPLARPAKSQPEATAA